VAQVTVTKIHWVAIRDVCEFTFVYMSKPTNKSVFSHDDVFTRLVKMKKLLLKQSTSNIPA